MVTAMAAPTFQRATLAARLRPRHLRIFSSMSGGGGETRRQLVLYSKPGCCLCDGLKEKLSVAFSLGGPHSLHSVDLQVRDITVNPEWEQKYQYEIPVLAKVLPDGTEEVLPRLSPRLGVELIQKKISTAFDQ
ncbi:Glutaredoxin-like domain-containing protein [Carex littledalei]|uniref:Glutaredoxin-like protein n=1 Tax=Carex littledalei TaxID=544730 RepID=A0A833QAC5_9POAL|nr:Glutaredoxin-like domain-containing protein [Carex littledalei]